MSKEVSELKKVALRLLTRREHSRVELINKLKLRDFIPSQIQTVVNNLTEQGWQSDRRYAENYVRHRLQKGFGPVRIAYELKLSGVEDCIVGEVLREYDEDWLNVLVAVYRKKYTEELSITRNEWIKRSRFLQHRGFNGALIAALFQHLNLKFE